MIDLDHFKRFNDTHGHMAGDHALCAAAGVIRAALRPVDFAVRYGGEEMMAILPHTSAQAGRDGGRAPVRRACAQAVVFDDMRLPLPHLTGSFGVASLRAGQDERAPGRSRRRGPVPRQGSGPRPHLHLTVPLAHP